MMTSAITLSAIAMVVVATAFVIGNIHSTQAFSNFLCNRQWRSVSFSQRNSNECIFSRSPCTQCSNLYSNVHFDRFWDDDGEDEDAEKVCDMNTDPPMLDWNLHSLLSSDPSMEARLIPLMSVYDAAANAAAERANSNADDSSMGEDLGDTIPSRAPSILPSRTTGNSGSPAGPVQSHSYHGPLSPSVAPYRMFVREYSRDMGHDGRFTVFGDDEGEAASKHEGTELNHMNSPSLQSDVVFSMDDPLEFIRDNLSYGGKTIQNNDETVVFIPGPHTAHDPITCIKNSGDAVAKSDIGARSSPERLKYISQVLDGIPMAQIHAGTHIDQGNLEIELSSDTMNSLLSFELLTDSFRKELSLLWSTKERGSLPRVTRCRLRARDLDLIHHVLSRTESIALPRVLGDKYFGSDTKGLKDTLIRLIDIAVRSVRGDSTSGAPPHLVLMTYSATSNVLAAALSEWKRRVTTPIEESYQHSSDDESTKTFGRDGVGVGVDEKSDGFNIERKVVFSEEEAEFLLHKALTVVTFSSLAQGFVDGPAYIHVSMNDDPLASSLGITKLDPKGEGKDAVILQALSPYLMDDDDDCGQSSFIYKNDAHNIDACVVQYFALVKRINGARSFREMYNLGYADSDSKKLDISASMLAVDYRSVGQLVIPPRIDCDLIPAMVRATGGERWLWNPSFQLGEGGVEGYDSPLPSLEYAQAEIENQFGYNSYYEIVENCPR